METTLKEFTLNKDKFKKEWMEIDYLRDVESNEKYSPEGLALVNGGKYVKVSKFSGEKLYLPPTRRVRVFYKSNINSIPEPTYSPQYNLCTIIKENKEMLNILERKSYAPRD